MIADIIPPPEGLANLSDETEDDLKDACEQYPKRRNQPFTLSRNAIKKIVALMHWVQDRTRLNEEPTFPAGYTRDEFLQQLREASERELILAYRGRRKYTVVRLGLDSFRVTCGIGS